MIRAGDVRRVAETLRPPGAGYVAALAETCARLGGSGEAVVQLHLFLDRIRDLGVDELGELHAETFGRGELAGAARLAAALAQGAAERTDLRAAVDVFALALCHLDAERNPFAHAIRALCCLLLIGARAPEEGEDGR